MKSSNTQQLFQQGLAYHQRGQLNEALKIYYQILEINPKHFDALQLTATLFLQCKKYSEALNFFKSALKIKSNFVPALINCGNVLLELGHFDEALKTYDKAIRLEPNNPNAYNNRGNTLKNLNRLDEALKNYDIAIQLKPDYAEAHNNRGSLLNDLKRFDEAIISLNKAIELKPDYAEAISNKSYIKLSLGEYEEGWQLHESRKDRKDRKNQYPKFPAPIWLGDTSIENKTLLVHSEQGLGDTIQFCRYLPMLQSFKPKKIIFYVEKPLMSLLSSFNHEITLIEKDKPLPSFDYYCPLMSLPLAFKTTVESIPANIPYIYLSQGVKSFWKNTLGKKSTKRIAIMHTTHLVDEKRSLTLDQLKNVFKLPFEFHSLQINFTDEDRKTLQSIPNLITYESKVSELEDAAGLIEQMDLVITVGQTVTHLSGALGAKTWILVPFVPSYRWLLDREDSPWYPTAKLFRQPQMGDWNSVIQQLISELEKF
jgi:tetratricopeptide (TPR) repeat protein